MTACNLPYRPAPSIAWSSSPPAMRPFSQASLDTASGAHGEAFVKRDDSHFESDAGAAHRQPPIPQEPPPPHIALPETSAHRQRAGDDAPAMSFNVGANYDIQKLPLRVRLALQQILYEREQAAEPTPDDVLSLAVQLICEYERALREHTPTPPQKVKFELVEGQGSGPSGPQAKLAAASLFREGTVEPTGTTEVVKHADVEEALRILTAGCSAEPKEAKWFKLAHEDEMKFDVIDGMAHEDLEARLSRDIENNEEEHKLIKMPKWCPCRCCRSKKEKEEATLAKNKWGTKGTAKVAPEESATHMEVRGQEHALPRGKGRGTAKVAPEESATHVEVRGRKQPSAAKAKKSRKVAPVAPVDNLSS